MEIQPIKNALSHAAALAEIEAIRFRMDQSGLVAKDLVPSIGPINRVYEVLAHKRPLPLMFNCSDPRVPQKAWREWHQDQAKPSGTGP